MLRFFNLPFYLLPRTQANQSFTNQRITFEAPVAIVLSRLNRTVFCLLCVLFVVCMQYTMCIRCVILSV